MSAEMRNEREIELARVAGVGDKRDRRLGRKEDSAPVEETEPICIESNVCGYASSE